MEALERYFVSKELTEFRASLRGEKTSWPTDVVKDCGDILILSSVSSLTESDRVLIWDAVINTVAAQYSCPYLSRHLLKQCSASKVEILEAAPSILNQWKASHALLIWDELRGRAAFYESSTWRAALELFIWLSETGGFDDRSPEIFEERIVMEVLLNGKKGRIRTTESQVGIAVTVRQPSHIGIHQQKSWYLDPENPLY
jgi:hypothetical protein